MNKFIKKLEEEYPNGVELYFVDYRDDMKEYPQELEDIVQTGMTDTCFDEFWDIDGIVYDILKEVFTSEEVDNEIWEDDGVRQEIFDWFYNNDTSNIIKDLLHNTNDQLILADLGVYVEESRSLSDEDKKRRIKEIFEELGVEFTEERMIEFDKIRSEAGYGGQLYACIMGDVSEFYNNDKNKIKLDGFDMVLLILDSINGSGYYDRINLGKDFIVDRKDLTIDNNHSYGVGEIFGPVYADEYLHTDFEFVD